MIKFTWKQTLGMGLAASLAGASCSNPGNRAGPEITDVKTKPRIHEGPLPEVATYVQGSTGFAAFSSKSVRQAAMIYPAAEMVAQEAPLSLTADDGTGLVLESLDAQAVIEGPLAFTELRMRFRNPQQRVLEGRFQITLPDGASVSRLSMKMEDGWREAEVVERMAARRAYEDFLHRKQDPMLLEKEAGNQFRARIFPIPANGVKEIIVSFSHELKGESGYTLPLRGLPEIAELNVHALVAAYDTSGLHYTPHEMNVRGVVPTTDFSVAGSTLQALRSGSHIVARVRPEIRVSPSRPTGVTILFDTSASRAPGFARQVKRLSKLIASIATAQGSDLPITVAAFDQEIIPVFRGRAGDYGKAGERALLVRRPLGASDLAGALAWAGQQDVADRILVIGDGISTSGDTEISGHAKILPEQIKRIDMLLVGGIRDTEAANRLVRGTRSVDGVVLSSEMSDGELARRLGAGTASVEFHVPGAEWVWPQVADGIQPGDEVLVYAGYPKGVKAPTNLAIEMRGAKSLTKVPTVSVPGPLLERSSVQAHIARLQGDYIEALADNKKAIKAQIVDISTKYRVLSDHTALLVLESESDYARFGIDRKALSDILVVGKNGLSLQQRNTLVMVAQDTLKTEKKSERFGRKKGRLKQRKLEVGKAEEDKDFRESADRLGGLDSSGAPAPDMDRAVEREQSAVSGGARMRDQARRPSPPPSPSAEPVSIVSEEVMSDDSETISGVVGGLSNGEIAHPVMKPQGPPALTGRMASIHNAISAGRVDEALAEAIRWRNEESGQVMALVALGEALEAAENFPLAARAYGSIIDLFPSRADLRRFAGARLSQLKKAGADLSVDTLKKAAEQRPDHLSVHRLLAYALVRAGKLEAAFDAIEAGLGRGYPSGRFAGGIRILQEDLGIIAAAWLAAEPNQKNTILTRLKKAGGTLATKPSTRFVLNWETDANDVDFHIYDAKGGHAYFSSKHLPSGGELFADVTTGYGPECFAIEGNASAYPYQLQIHYYSRGPMGYGMGQVEILQHDGNGGLAFDDRPFVVMNDSAYVDLGKIKAPL